MKPLLQSRRPFASYAEEEPLEAYALLGAAGLSVLVGGLVAAERRGRLPTRIDLADVALIGVATHKLSRLLTTDSVTSFLRAPFVRLTEKSGTNSLHEEARGSGLQRAVGELVSCPECTDYWVASALFVGLLHAPRPARVLGAFYSSLALADFMQFLYAGLKHRA